MYYQRLNEQDIAVLRDICGPENVLSGTEINEDYCRDELSPQKHNPDAVVFPGSTGEVARVMRYAWEKTIAVTPRGSGSGLCGGAVPLYGGIVLSTARLNKILSIDQDNLMAEVEPGVLLLEFQRAVEEQDLFYPPDPGEKTATVGGNVSTNAGGMRAVKYGVTRDYVLGLEAVLPDGQIIETGGKVAKNSSGYNLTQLLVGSEGTLAVITKVIVRLLPKPGRQISLLVPFPSLSKAIEAVPAIISARIIPSAVEFLQKEVIEAAEHYLHKEFPDSSASAYLLLAFHGSDQVELDSSYQQAAEVCLARGAIDVLIANSTERQESIWQARGAFLEALKAMSELEEVDVVVPPAHIARFIAFTEELQTRYQVRILSFGHAGDGNLHIYLLRDGREPSEWEALANAIMDELYQQAAHLMGQVSGEHGIGYAKKRFLAESLGNAQIELMKGIKRAFDPKSILNPGKIWG